MTKWHRSSGAGILRCEGLKISSRLSQIYMLKSCAIILAKPLSSTASFHKVGVLEKFVWLHERLNVSCGDGTNADSFDLLVAGDRLDVRYFHGIQRRRFLSTFIPHCRPVFTLAVPSFVGSGDGHSGAGRPQMRAFDGICGTGFSALACISPTGASRSATLALARGPAGRPHRRALRRHGRISSSVCSHA